MRVEAHLLHADPALIPTVCHWLTAEWPAYYGPGGPGDVAADVRGYAQHADRVPLARVASVRGVPCGFGALKAEPFATHPHLGPWLGALVVQPVWRGQGVGAFLIAQLEADACRLGFAALYTATATADRLFVRGGWSLLAEAEHQGAPIRIYEKSLERDR
ncbi:GNAT family N-acetyltransferase [Inhella gelatinilytica]|uniref:GNAT family N-acetyltransferase n=1 Tax=Inhella gelatinilytica TaxID=2795030 RepID=A0A931IWG6_9BURK|nr:GNAT family N-acetyltransferase [Inhella gelatinilytica]MBH9551893.1 GNAT family N-acetyltransferase [Inhella gelatinilytica]